MNLRLPTAMALAMLIASTGCSHSGAPSASAPAAPAANPPAASAASSAAVQAPPAAVTGASGAVAQAPPAAAQAPPAAAPGPGYVIGPKGEPVPEGAPLIVLSDDLVHIEYHIYGHGEPAVILIHGWAGSSAYWYAQLDALKSHYTVVTLDLGGHGASGRNRSDWSMAHYGGDVAAVARELPNHQIVLVGHSMGGPVALEAAPRIGSRVIGIIGIDTFRRVGLPPPRPEVVAREIEPFRQNFIGAMRDFVPKLFRHRADPTLVRKVSDDMSHATAAVAVSSLVSLNAMDYTSVLAAVHVPIIAIDSDFGEPLDVKRIRKVVPDFKADVLHGDDYFLMLEDPQHLNPLLLREIQALAGHSS